MFFIVFLFWLLGGCALHPQLADVQIEPEAIATAPSLVVPTDRASVVALQALAYLGVPYRTGGLSPHTGFDCSGLVAYAYREGAALRLPRNAYDLSRLGEPIRRESLRPGDLVFYNTQQRDFSHVGIYLGEDRFIHAPSSRGEVRLENLRADYWARRYNGARRIIAQQ